MKTTGGILQLIDSLQAGGAERMAVNIANALVKNGIKSYLISTRAEGVLKSQLQEEVNYLFLKKQNVIDFKALYKLRNYVKLHKITIIHAHSSSYFLACLLKCTLPYVKIVWHDHYGKSEQLTNRPSFVLKKCAVFFNACIVVNKQLQSWVMVTIKTPNVKIINNFVVQFDEKNKDTTLKGNDGERILCLANLRPQKNHLNLLEAFKIVVKKYPDWTLHLVGNDLKDVYAAELKNYIELNLENKVFLYDSCEDIQHILSQVSVGVLASDSEGLPLALLEYGWAKLGAVVTNVGDCNRVIEHGINGFLAPPKDKDKLAEKLIFLIEHPEERSKMGEALYTKVQRNFSEEVAIEQLINLYGTLE